MPLPRWIEPQLCKLATKAPIGAQWVHEIKLDGYWMAASVEGGRIRLLTRSGLDWTVKYTATEAASCALKGQDGLYRRRTLRSAPR
jgi:ATP-dependent DNA ligase